jgi:hypothetical protein
VSKGRKRKGGSTVQKIPRESWIEPALAVASMVALNWVLGERYRLTPQWVPVVLAAALLGPAFVAHIRHDTPLWLRIERLSIASTILVMLGLNTLTLLYVVDEVLFRSSGIVAETLFSTSIAIWTANVVGFALLYWELDRGGPDARMSDAPGWPDFAFPAYIDPMMPRDWRPHFMDYLFVAFTTSTAFSPTEAMPLSRRAKALMIVQAVISLVTIIVVASRAIGIIQ